MSITTQLIVITTAAWFVVASNACDPTSNTCDAAISGDAMLQVKAERSVEKWTSVVSDVIPEEAVADDDAVTGKGGLCGLHMFANLSANPTNGDVRGTLAMWCEKKEYGYSHSLCTSIVDQVFTSVVDSEHLVDAEMCAEIRELVVTHYIQQRRESTSRPQKEVQRKGLASLVKSPAASLIDNSADVERSLDDTAIFKALKAIGENMP